MSKTAKFESDLLKTNRDMAPKVGPCEKLKKP